METLGDDEFYHLSECCVADNFQLVRRKGIYPYNYMDSFARFVEIELPPQSAFFSKLSGDPCTDADYAHAVAVWNAFACETHGDYHAIYLQLDVLLLADFFEKFRKICLNYCSLDPVHYYTMPGMAWDAAKKFTI